MVGLSSYLRALLQSKPALVAILVAAIVGTATIGVTAAASTGLISACVNNSSGAIHVITAATSATCAKNETLVSWNAQGAAGPQGPAGPTGPQGATGATGVPRARRRVRRASRRSARTAR